MRSDRFGLHYPNGGPTSIQFNEEQRHLKKALLKKAKNASAVKVNKISQLTTQQSIGDINYEN